MNKRDRIIHLIREMMAVGNGGLTSNPAPGKAAALAGFDRLMNLGMFRRTRKGTLDRRAPRKYKSWLGTIR